jgi:hypothetical protein
VNRDQSNAHTVRVEFDAARRKLSFNGTVSVTTFGREQYVWRDEGPASHADPDGPPLATTVTGSPQGTFVLPKASITVLRGKVAGL